MKIHMQHLATIVFLGFVGLQTLGFDVLRVSTNRSEHHNYVGFDVPQVCGMFPLSVSYYKHLFTLDRSFQVQSTRLAAYCLEP